MTPERFLREFGALASTQGAMESLRGLVLRLAVSGRISEARPGDEPVEALLSMLDSRSQEQKRSKQKQSNGLSDPAPQPTERLPSRWAWAPFHRVASIRSNLTSPKGKHGLPHVAPDNIEKRTGVLLPHRTVGEDGVTSSKHRFFPGQILYSKIRPNLSKAVVVDFEGLCSADMYPLEAKINTGYLHRFILSPVFLEQVTRNDNRLAMPKVNQEQLSSIWVSIPPLPEQKRIVEKVDQLMALCDELETKQSKKRQVSVQLNKAALDAVVTAPTAKTLKSSWQRVQDHFEVLYDVPENVKELRQTILQLAVMGKLVKQDPKDEPAEKLLGEAPMADTPPRGQAVPSATHPEPPGWTLACLWQLLSEPLANGRSVPDGNGFPVLRLSALRTSSLDYSECKTGAWTKKEATPFLVQEGDILLARGNGAIRLVGRASMAGPVPFGVAFPDTAIRVRPFRGCIDPSYLLYAWASPQLRAQIEEAAKTTSGLFKVSQGDVYSIQVPLPPRPEQVRIVTKVNEFMALCDDLEAKLNKSREDGQRLMKAVVESLVA